MQAYMDTAAADAALLAKDLRRRLLAGVVAMAGASLGLLIGVAWTIGSVWDTPWRNPVMATMLAVFALCAVIGAWLALRPHKPGSGSFANLRREMSLDQAVIEELCASERLQENRGAIRKLFMQAVVPAVGATFLRGAIMRLLLNMTGLGGLLGR
jgi:hypothetical protein